MGCLIVLGWKHSEVFSVQWFHAEAQPYDDWWPHKTNKDKGILNIPDYYFLNSTAEFPTWEQMCPSTPAVPNYVLLARWKPWPGTSEHRWITITESQQGLGWNRLERLFGSNKWPNRSWYHSSIQDGAANSSRNRGEIKEESLFYISLLFYKPLMLWCFMLSITAGRESILAGAEKAPDTGWSSDSNSSWCASEKLSSSQIQT